MGGKSKSKGKTKKQIKKVVNKKAAPRKIKAKAGKKQTKGKEKVKAQEKVNKKGMGTVPQINIKAETKPEFLKKLETVLINMDEGLKTGAKAEFGGGGTRGGGAGRRNSSIPFNPQIYDSINIYNNGLNFDSSSNFGGGRTRGGGAGRRNSSVFLDSQLYEYINVYNNETNFDNGSNFGGGRSRGGGAGREKPGENSRTVNEVEIPKEEIKSFEGGSRTGTVWDNIVPTQDNYPNTKIPRSFVVEVNGQKMWVHGNATEHMYEDVYKGIVTGKATAYTNPDLYTQQLMEDFYGSLEQATSSGIVYGENIRCGNWEFIFSAPRQEGQLPVIKHAQFNGWH